MPRYDANGDPIPGPAITPIAVIRDGHADLLAREEAVSGQITEAWQLGMDRIDGTLGVVVSALEGMYTADGYQVPVGRDMGKAYSSTAEDADLANGGITDAAGYKLDPVQYFKDQGYPDLLAKVAAQAMQGVADQSAVYVTTAQRAAIRQGTSDAQSATEAAMHPLLDQLAGAWSFRPGDDAMRALEGKASNGSPLDQLFNGFGQDIAQVLHQTLTAGLASGTNPREVARQMTTDLGVPRQRALVIARNEMVDSYRQAALDSYQANNDVLGGWIWCADLGPRTCAMCLAMNGQQFPLDEEFDSHACCRCAPLPATLGWQDILDNLGIDAEEVDFSDLPDTTIQLPSGQDWLARQPTKTQTQILGPGKQTLYQAGKLTLADLVGKGTSNQWGGYRYEVSLKDLGFDANDIAKARRDLEPAPEVPADFFTHEGPNAASSKRLTSFADLAQAHGDALATELKSYTLAQLKSQAKVEDIPLTGKTKVAIIASIADHFAPPKAEATIGKGDGFSMDVPNQPLAPAAARSQAGELPPISEMPTSQSSAMEAWLNDNRPDQTWHVAAVHPDLMPDVVSTLDRMQQAYPDAHFHLEAVTTEGDWTGPLAVAYAYVDADGHTMHLNPAAFGNPAEFVQHYLYDATHTDATGRTWLAQVDGLSPVEAIMIHEFGHVVDSYLHYSREAFTGVVSSGGLGRIGTTWDRLRTQLLPRTLGRLSQYADTTSNEMFAETFVLLHGTTAQRGALGDNIATIRTFLDLVMGSEARAPGDFQGLGDLTDSEQRRAAEATLRDLARQLGLPYP